MKALRFAVVALVLVSANSAFASRGKENCQAQKNANFNATEPRQRAAEVTRVFDGKGTAPTQKPQSEGKAISEKGS